MSKQFVVRDAAQNNFIRLKNWMDRRKNDASFPTNADWEFIEEGEKELSTVEKRDFREELFYFAAQKEQQNKTTYLAVVEI